jgi:hypothetical protein
MDPGHVLYHLCMSQYFRSVSRSRRSGGVLLLVGVLAGVTVGGGVGVIAASSTKTVTVCADKKTGMLRYAKNGRCAKTETKVLLNQTGVAGATGAKGETGTAGANGTNGAKGADGAPGVDGAPGADGVNGVNGAAGSSFSARSVCGLNGTTLCAIGLQGPGGGTIFYVDTDGKYSDFDYLEVAPANTASTIEWSTTTPNCGLTADTSCRSTFVTTSGEALKYLAIGTGRAATAAIVARHDAGIILKGSYAAGVADEYTTATASDWWLPSRDEMNEVCKYARQTNQSPGGGVGCFGGELLPSFSPNFYWTSSEVLEGAYGARVFDLGGGGGAWTGKAIPFRVRPVRGF